MNIPAFAPYPPVKYQKDLVPEEWEACLDAWISLGEVHLRLPPKDFAKVSQGQSLAAFLLSYYHAISEGSGQSTSSHSTKEHILRRICFLLTHRILTTAKSPSKDLLSWQFLADFSHVHLKSQSLERLLESVWQRHQEEVERSLQPLKASLIKRLESGSPGSAEGDIKQLNHFLYSSADAGSFFMIGSDFFDALSSSYTKSSPSLQRGLVTLTYLGLVSLIKGEKPNHSLLFDNLYSLKSQAGMSDGPSGLLGDLVTNTPLLSKLNSTIRGKDADRAQALSASLSPFRSSAMVRRRRPSRRVFEKGKEKSNDAFGHGAFSGELHIHQMSLITQVQDVFPDLGSGFVAKLLDEYSDDPEQVTAHLLDDSLPSHLVSLDRAAQLPSTGTTVQERSEQDIEHLAPRHTPPPQRRNVFDNDEFDRLEVDASRLHIGRRDAKLTADAILTDRNKAPNKSAILSALAAFDSDDDERDDTYDEADVGGTVDYAHPDGEDRDRNAQVSTDSSTGAEEALFRAWKLDPTVFGRNSADLRRSPARMALKGETGMTDEAIEGWAVMLSRDPRRLRRLEDSFSAFDGQQAVIERTSYRESEDTEESDGAGSGGRGGFSGRGRGRGRGGGRGKGGNVAGPSNDSTTQAARQRKDASKGSRANHNRRDQRARKMARGGFPG